MIDTVEEFLRGQSAEDLILRFDSDFDVTLRHGLCIGLLEMLGGFAPSDFGDDDDKRAVFVGASWCRIIRSDVAYQVLLGLEAAADSRNEATVLAQHVLADGADGTKIRAYAAARWHDGAGKIHFRCGDFAEARLLFETAVGIAHQAGLHSCLPDLQSNLIRARFDEQRLAGARFTAQLRSSYETLVDEARAAAASYGISGSELRGLERDVVAAVNERDINTELSRPRWYRPNWSCDQRELVRGLSSALHNLAITCKDEGEGERSAQLSWESAAISWALADRYRLAQVLNHQADLAMTQDEGLGRAKHLYEQVVTLPGVRAQRIARQRLARIAVRDGQPVEALRIAKELLRLLEAERGKRGGDMGFDAVFEKYTVEAYRGIMSSQAFADDADEQDACDVAEAEMIRSVRRVVKTSTYKTAYAELVQPYFLRQVHARIRDDQWMEAVSLAEEATSRELQDLLATVGSASPRRAGTPTSHARPLQGPENAHVVPHRLGRRGTARRSIAGQDDAARVLQDQRSEFERTALAAPLSVVPHDPEIGNEARRFTANHSETAIVRYVVHGEANGQPTDLGAYLFRDGRRPAFIPLEIERLDDLQFVPEAGPTPELARRLWDILFEPIWGDGLESADGARPSPERLVIVPAGPLFRLPLHLALREGWTQPLAARVLLSFSVSLTSHVKRSRYLLAQQPFDSTDDLCVLAPQDEAIYPGEIDNLGWNPEHFHVAGQVPQDVGDFQYWGRADRDGLDALIARQPEIFVYIGHGRVVADKLGADPGLVLDDGFVSHYSLGSRVRLPRNKWTLLGACVTGQGATLGGGEVSGFLRAFIGAGAGALGVTLWNVDNDAIASAIQALLVAARTPGGSAIVDAIKVLRDHYDRAVVPDADPAAVRGWAPQRARSHDTVVLERQLRACPLVLYL
jgi:hypothetical protein